MMMRIPLLVWPILAGIWLFATLTFSGIYGPRPVSEEKHRLLLSK